MKSRFTSLAKLHGERSRKYNYNYRRFGAMLKAFFPNGIILRSEDDFLRFAFLVHIFGKLSRYAENFKKGGHADSLDDISVYAQMLQETDECSQKPAHIASGVSRKRHG